MSPEYLVPGVYIEEFPANSRPKAGVSARPVRAPVRDPAILSDKTRRELRTVSARLRKRRSGCQLLCIGGNKKARLAAARALGLDLGHHLHRVNLDRIISKYIGETEKNLRRVLAAAETAGAILFFDEADALFGRRSEVKDSHDRYANAEVSRLLKRIEAFRGLVILATNRKENLDAAFLRRIRFIIAITPTKTDQPRKPERRSAKNE